MPDISNPKMIVVKKQFAAWPKKKLKNGYQSSESCNSFFNYEFGAWN